jgi:hypothetical protein
MREAYDSRGPWHVSSWADGMRKSKIKSQESKLQIKTQKGYRRR